MRRGAAAPVRRPHFVRCLASFRAKNDAPPIRITHLPGCRGVPPLAPTKAALVQRGKSILRGESTSAACCRSQSRHFRFRGSASSVRLSCVIVCKWAQQLSTAETKMPQLEMGKLCKNPLRKSENMCDTIPTKLLPFTRFENTAFSTSYNSKRDISEADNGTNKLLSSSGLPDYTQEDERLRSYTNWTNTHISPLTLSKAGFYFINRGDVVRCAYCGIEGHCWMPNDNPMDDHRTWNPNCPFVVQNTCNNNNNNNNNNQRDGGQRNNNVGQDLFGNYEVLRSSLAEDEDIGVLHSIAGLIVKVPPHNRDYLTTESRINSFKHWPTGLKQKPDIMAKAGFYYVGIGDQVICYCCGGGLKNWEENDKPWEQHALWFPKCTYLLLQKGKEFVNKVQCRKDANVAGCSDVNNIVDDDDDSNDDDDDVNNVDDVTTNSAIAIIPAAETSNSSNIPNASSHIETKEHNNAAKLETIMTTTTTPTTTSTTTTINNKMMKTTSTMTNTSCNNIDKRSDSDIGLCKICYSEGVCLVFHPCEHASTCVECGLAVDKCPVCRAPVQSACRMILS